MKYTLIFLLILFFLPDRTSAQAYFNLKQLSNISVTIMDEGNFISSKVQQKLLTEIKLKLRSAGITLNPGKEIESELRFDIRAVETKGGFVSNYKLLLNLFLIESGTLSRTGSQMVSVITYFDDEFWLVTDTKEIEKFAYEKIMDIMLIRFLDRYLDQNP